MILLVRHAKAGSRKEWEGPDHLRPLSKKGRKQAARMVDQLAGFPVSRVLSSPYARCMETVEPLAERLHLPVEQADELAEGAPVSAVVALVRRLRSENPVLSTHGDVVPALLDALVRLDRLALPEEYPFAKGSTWVLEAGPDERFTTARYLPAPG